MRDIMRNHGMSIVALALFAVSLAGLALVGWHDHNQLLAQHGRAAIGLGAFLGTGHWWEAVFENWESEFLQMALFVYLSACLHQKGSAESNDPDDPEAAERREAEALAGDPRTFPWPVRRGGGVAGLYAHSLSLALLALFVASFVGHALAGTREAALVAALHHEAAPSLWGYVSGPTFWSESLENWQSEFMSVGALTVLTIFLRERKSPQSKPVAAPHDRTGAD